MFTHASAAIAAASRTDALPVSVRRNSRRGGSRFRAHAVRPENDAVGDDPVTGRLPSMLSLRRDCEDDLPAGMSGFAELVGPRDLREWDDLGDLHPHITGRDQL